MELRVTPTDILKVLMSNINSIYPFLNSIVFAPSLDYVNVVNLHRNSIDSQINTIKDKDGYMFPLLAWNRSNLKRTVTKRITPDSSIVINGETHKARVFVGEVEATLNFYSASIEDIERIETDILFEKGLAAIKTISMNIGDSTIEYGITWNYELESLEFELESNFYKSLSANVLIQGAMIYIDELTSDDVSNVIFKLNFGIYDCNGKLIESTSLEDVSNILESQGENVKAEYNKWKGTQNGNK